MASLPDAHASPISTLVATPVDAAYALAAGAESAGSDDRTPAGADAPAGGAWPHALRRRARSDLTQRLVRDDGAARSPLAPLPGCAPPPGARARAPARAALPLARSVSRSLHRQPSRPSAALFASAVGGTAASASAGSAADAHDDAQRPWRRLRLTPRVDRSLARRGLPGVVRALHEASLLALVGVLSSFLAYAVSGASTAMLGWRLRVSQAHLAPDGAQPDRNDGGPSLGATVTAFAAWAGTSVAPCIGAALCVRCARKARAARLPARTRAGHRLAVGWLTLKPSPPLCPWLPYARSCAPRPPRARGVPSRAATARHSPRARAFRCCAPYCPVQSWTRTSRQ